MFSLAEILVYGISCLVWYYSWLVDCCLLICMMTLNDVSLLTLATAKGIN